MSLVTVGKNGTVYPRKFDHDEARRLKESGLTYAQIAERFGVSKNGVVRVLNANARAAVDRHVRRHQESRRVPCLGGCGRLTWTHGTREKSGYCRTCYAREFNRVSVRDTDLRCSECHEWKPDREFPRANGRTARRDRHSVCRSCQAAARQRARESRKVPCAACGQPRMNPKDTGAGIGREDSGLCRSCYLDSRRAA